MNLVAFDKRNDDVKKELYVYDSEKHIIDTNNLFSSI